MHYSRLDVRFRDIAALREGRDFRVIEINGASSEATHIWDRNGTLGELYRTLFFQYRTLFEIGVEQRRQGVKPPRLRDLLRAWRHERTLTRQYPSTDLPARECRSEERRVGKECVRAFGSRWSPYR